MNYLYNGVGPLPDINTVWTDKEKYPYAYIHEFNGDYHAYVLRISAGTQEVSSHGGSGLDFDDGEWYELKDDSTEWEKSNSFGGTLLWANFDVLYNSAQGDLAGTLYLAASDPVPVTARNPAAMLMGFQLGTAIRRMRGMKQPEQPPVQTIVGYRYGDSPTLPDINSVWTDKETYPYAAILYYTTDNTYMVIFTPLPLYCYEGDCFVSENMTVIAGEVDGAEWNVQSLTLTACVLGDHQFVWASYDIDNYSFAAGGSDGSTYLAASEPVPVYE